MIDLSTTFVININMIEQFITVETLNLNAGDEVYIDKAIIVKVGFRQTIFQIEDERGITWRYVWNDRIKFLRIEKVVRKDD